MSEWVSFFDRLPVAGQTIYYYGPDIGVWRGTYCYSPTDPVSPHLIHCGESPGVVDRMDAPWWQPCAGQERPAAPDDPYPSNCPGESDE